MMCEWGTNEKLYLRIPADLSSTKKVKWRFMYVDKCIAPIVMSLQEAGIDMRASCCGHNQRPGNIALADGRELIICPDFKTGREVDKLFPDINGKDQPLQLKGGKI
jgi:hypothetical protein